MKQALDFFTEMRKNVFNQNGKNYKICRNGNNMENKQIIKKLKKQTFSRDDIYNVAVSVEPEFSHTDIRNLLEKLLASKLIVRVGRNQYQKKSKAEIYDYHPLYSDKAKLVINAVLERYPLVDFRVWELSFLNEFVNHQIAHNKIFVEVENDICDFLYQDLAEKFQDAVLLKPSSEEIYRYGKDDGIIVLKLISEAPKGKNSKYEMSLEKLIVDMFSNKLMKDFVSRGDYPLMLDEMFSKYSIDQITLFRYAKRRNKASEIIDFLKQKTSVKIHSEEML